MTSTAELADRLHIINEKMERHLIELSAFREKQKGIIIRLREYEQMLKEHLAELKRDESDMR